jgi:S1-C subfamily serine protease
VQPGGAADTAGIRPGDIITRIGTNDITTLTSLAEALAADKPGQRTRVTFLRGGTERTVGVRLGEQ